MKTTLRSNHALLLLLLLALLNWCDCSTPPRENQKGAAQDKGSITHGTTKTVLKDGIPHVFNTSQPQHGIIHLELAEILTLDSTLIDSTGPVFFSTSSWAGNGDLYIGDFRNHFIYRFTSRQQGTSPPAAPQKLSYKGRFMRKGEGPSEIPYGVFTLQVIDDRVWAAAPRKILWFSLEGNYIDEIKFKKKYRNIEVLGENRFIGNFSGPNGKHQCALFDDKEKVSVVYMEDEGAGSTRIETEVEGKPFRLNFSVGSITPHFFHHFDRESSMLYIALSSRYTITLKSLDGHVKKVIHREYKHRTLTPGEKLEVVELLFAREPAPTKELIAKHLPGTLCAISGFQVLPGGYLLVNRVTGLNTVEIDLFDPEGQYIYQLEMPVELKNKRFMFHRGNACIMKNSDTGSVYRVYRIKNFPVRINP